MSYELVKSTVTSTYKKRLRYLLRSHINGRNLISTINMWTIPILRYIAGIVNWTQAELKSLDTLTRKLLTMHKSFSRIDDVGRLYVPHSLWLEMYMLKPSGRVCLQLVHQVWPLAMDGFTIYTADPCGLRSQLILMC